MYLWGTRSYNLQQRHLLKIKELRNHSFNIVCSVILVILIIIAIRMGISDYERTAIAEKQQDAYKKQYDTCTEHMNIIASAKRAWMERQVEISDAPARVEYYQFADNDLFGTNGFIATKPRCPSGGTYTIGGYYDYVSCSVHGRYQYR